MKPFSKVLANALVLVMLGSTAAVCAEARFLSFADELKRARSAIGPEAECHVFIEEILARCELRSAGAHAIEIQFADMSMGVLPRKSLRLTRGNVEPALFTNILAAYGLPTEITARCMSPDIARSTAAKPEFAAYVGDYLVTCTRDVVAIAYARPF